MVEQRGERQSLVVIYDTANGDIVHEHGCTSFPGAEHPDEQELEREALQYASEAGHDMRRLSVLHGDPAFLSRNVEYAVDTRNRMLIEVHR